jgi:RIO kinase 1
MKTSYESSADVQRWLQEQSLEGGGKPEFSPTFLAGQRDKPWVLSSLAQFYEQDLITDVLRVIKSGKEATVYCCVADPATGRELLAAKVYRPRMFRSLKHDAVYRESRVIRDVGGRVVADSRRRRKATKKTERGRAAQVTNWIEHEFKTQRLLYEAGADVPCPLAQIGNAVLMDYIGDEAEAAPLLREVDLPPEEAQPLFDAILRNIELFLACDRVHGDLSEYNILYWQGAGARAAGAGARTAGENAEAQPRQAPAAAGAGARAAGAATIIDFAQAVDPRYNPDDVFTLLARDIARVCRYFARAGVEADAEALAIDLWTRYLTGALI